jgi:hypothetical protein
MSSCLGRLRRADCGCHCCSAQPCSAVHRAERLLAGTCGQCPAKVAGRGIASPAGGGVMSADLAPSRCAALLQMRHAKPGVLSEELRRALGMADSSPPPWLINMQRYGPPPSYPDLKARSLLLSRPPLSLASPVSVCTPCASRLQAGGLQKACIAQLKKAGRLAEGLGAPLSTCSS